MKKNFFTLLLFIFFCSSAFSQGAKLKGTVINSETKEPLQGVSVKLSNQNMTTTSESDGSFYFENVKPGNEVLIISSPDVQSTALNVSISQGGVTDVGEVAVVVNARSQMVEGSLNLLDESSIGDDDTRNDVNVSSLMTTSSDVFLSKSGYDFSAVRFKLRGYDYRYSDTYINGVNFNDVERGGFSFGIFGGLNDVTRNQDVVLGMQTSGFTYSQAGGAVNFNTDAGSYNPGGKIGVAYTNRNYKLKGSALYSTGMMRNGWAVTGALAYRWADEGFIAGTFYNSFGASLAVEKMFNPKNSLSLIVAAAPTQRGQQSAAPGEIQDLLGHYYNSYWGYQNGKKRNSRIITSCEPIAVLTHTWKIDNNTKLKTGLGFKYTNYGSTALNRTNAFDPRPDYYKNLPNFQALQYPNSPEWVDYYRQQWLNDPTVSQIDWDNLYRSNRNNTKDGSVYFLENRHNDQMNFTLNSTLNTKLSEKVSLAAGIEARTTKGMHYKTIDDLLGGEYVDNINIFAIRDFGDDPAKAQYDLNNPYQHLGKGGRYGYDYDMYSNSAGVWLQNTHRYKKWDIFYGYKFSYTDFYRYGNMRNGLAPDNSYGKGATYSFINQSSKFGLTYKLSGRHMFSANVSYSTLPPLIYDAYLSPRVKDNAIPNLKSESNFTAEASYNISTPIIRGRLTAYQTNFYDQAKMYNMYSDADGTFVNYALTGINKVHRGIEFGAEVKINSNLSVSAIGTIAEYYYNNRPSGTTSYENGSAPDTTEVVYLKNFYVGGTPQTAGSIGVHYFYKYWFFDVNLNGFDRTYIDISPMKRTDRAIASIVDNTFDDNSGDMVARVKQATTQEKFAGGATLDFSIGKSLRIQRKYTLNINLQFNNILNNTNLKTGGYEYNRIDINDATSNRFPSYYYYAQGFNCFLNAGLRF